MISLISLDGNTVSVVSLPSGAGALESIDWNFTTAVSTVTSVFTGQVQTQQWPGADMWSGTATLPPLTQAQADAWISALMQMQGMSNAFQLGDPLKKAPRGSALGTPVADGSIAMVAGGQTLYTTNWDTLQTGLLLPGDYLQIGFRLHRVLDEVISDNNGKATISIWPSLREPPVNGEPLVLDSPVGLFRLGNNKNTWSSGVDSLTHLSFVFQEYR
jgi:hypothetical protein